MLIFREVVLDKELRQYSIPFVGLKKGTHYFNFEIKDDFFKHFKNSPIGESNLNVFVTFEKRDTQFDLLIDVEGTVKTDCDRCLKKIDLPVHYRQDIYVKFESIREQNPEDDPDIIYIGQQDTYLDLTQIMYEFSVLSLPLQKNCEETNLNENCDKEVLDKLNQKKDNKIQDPRWDKLKNLNLK